MSMVASLHGLVAVAMPMCIETIMQAYGFRGCMAILAALNMHVLFGMIALHPVEWYQKKTLRKTDDLELSAESDKLLKANQPDLPNEKSLWTKIVDFLDLTLLAKPVYANICLGMSLALFADLTFFTIQPGYLRQLLFSNTDIALIVSMGATGDLCSRLFVTAVSSCTTVQARHLFLAGLFASIGSQMGECAGCGEEEQS